jgi:uncharacterized protein (UPF0276 family)
MCWSIWLHSLEFNLKKRTVKTENNMIDANHFRTFALHLGFSADRQEVSDVLPPTYGENGEVTHAHAIVNTSL